MKENKIIMSTPTSTPTEHPTAEKIAECVVQICTAEATATTEGFLSAMGWERTEGICWIDEGGHTETSSSNAYEIQLELNHTQLLGYLERLLADRAEMLREIASEHKILGMGKTCVCHRCTEYRTMSREEKSNATQI